MERILSDIDVVVWSVKLPTYEMLFVTPSVEKLYGISVENSMKDNAWWEKSIHPNDKRVIFSVYDALQNKVGKRIPFILKNKFSA